MRHHYKSILIGSTVACILNTTYTALIAKLFGMDYFLAISLFPKSVTTAMAVGISEKMQGITTVTFGRSCYYRNLDISFRTCLFKDDWY